MDKGNPMDNKEIREQLAAMTKALKALVRLQALQFRRELQPDATWASYRDKVRRILQDADIDE